MQVFVPYPSPIDVAKCLDSSRLRKQVLEAYQILNAISGQSNAWKNHPVAKMYASFKYWLEMYRTSLKCYMECDSYSAAKFSSFADESRPFFLTKDFCDQHKRRLYTKSPTLYPQFASYGTSEENWYMVDGQIVKYINGKRI